MSLLYKSSVGLFATSMLVGCGATQLVSTPVANIDTIPLKITELNEEEKKAWGHADLFTDTIPGMSLEKAYKEILGHKKGKTVVVAVVDSGIDLEHEDLDGVLWTNKGERPGNGVDDDKNGYVDDVHGYNFLGESYNEQLEFARMLRLGIGNDKARSMAQSELDESYEKALQNKQQYEQYLQVTEQADAAIKKALGKESYTKEEVMALKPETEELQQKVAMIRQLYQYGETIDEVKDQFHEGINHFTDQLNYNLNKDFDGRTVVGDNPYDLNDRGYGNGNPMHRAKDETHGTHVAGIIAAERNNGIGAKGVANNVRIMALRAVPNGDEYDKDIALAIRYAVDNGASIINCSFGKSFSPNANWVHDAIKYAASKDVLIVHAAGNSGDDLDDNDNPNYPNDHNFTDTEISDNVLTVGALTSSYGSDMVASFSNYGTKNVDVFAPGKAIYSTVPNDEYDFLGGTSMAAPAVAGVAALIRSYYPKLTAKQVKWIIMESGLTAKTSVVLDGSPEKARPFSRASKSGKMVNAYNSLLMANRVSKGKHIAGSKAK